MITKFTDVFFVVYHLAKARRHKKFRADEYCRLEFHKFVAIDLGNIEAKMYLEYRILMITKFTNAIYTHSEESARIVYHLAKAHR